MAKEVNKLVFDTNVLISAFAYPSGAVREIMEHVFSKKIEVYISATILDEYGRVLEQKFRWKKQDIMENIKFLSGVFIMTEPEESVSLIKKGPDDDRYWNARWRQKRMLL